MTPPDIRDAAAAPASAPSAAAQAGVTIDVSVTRTEGAWEGTFDADGAHIHVHARTFRALTADAEAAASRHGISPSALRLVTSYEDAKYGAERAVAEAEAAARTAQVIRRSLVRKMRADGLSMPDVAAILGLSHQRISQLLSDQT